MRIDYLRLHRRDAMPALTPKREPNSPGDQQ
jgi:hypothetical protein